MNIPKPDDKEGWVKFIAETTFYTRTFQPEEVKPPGPPPWGDTELTERDCHGKWRYYYKIKDGPWLDKFGQVHDK